QVPGDLVIGDGQGGTNADIVRILTNDQINPASTVTIHGSGLLDLNSHDQTIGPLILDGGRVSTGSGTLTLNGDVTTTAGTTPPIDGNLALGLATRTFNVAGGSPVSVLTVSAAIDGGNAAGITKAGPGTLILSGTNTYPGTTSATAGILRI